MREVRDLYYILPRCAPIVEERTIGACSRVLQKDVVCVSSREETNNVKSVRREKQTERERVRENARAEKDARRKFNETLEKFISST